MKSIVDSILHLAPIWVYLLVALLVFAEDALFVGFVIPGETAAVIGGVVASQGRVNLGMVIAIVIGAAIIGDTVGYEVGRHVGPRILRVRILDKRRKRLDEAQDFLRRRGGIAVFLGRFVAFFRAVMPALAGTSRMPYRRFLAFNAAGGIVWGAGFVLLGYLAGNSYGVVQKYVGRGSAIFVALIAIGALVAWHIHKRREEAEEEDQADDVPADQAEDRPRTTP
ncbi:MAG: rane-associated protein [Actinomycetota bacterium]|nr:rane-associated protein [Actinomycetota bacterium]